MKILSLSTEANAWIKAIKAGDQLIRHNFDATNSLDWPAIRAFAIENNAEVIVVPKLPPADIIENHNLENLLFEFKPVRIKKMLNSVLDLGRRIDLMKPLMNYVGKAEYQLELMRRERKYLCAGILQPGVSPAIACLTSLNPLMSAGGWMHDMIENLAGKPAFIQHPPAGEHTLIEYHDQPITWAALEKINPDFIILAPRLFSENLLDQFMEQFKQESANKKVDCRDSDQVYLVKEAEFMHSAGPILYEGINLLSHIIYRSALTKKTAHKPFVQLKFPFELPTSISLDW